MALQFIFGGSGSGKSYELYQRIIKEAGENPALNYIVLVPEQFTMQTQRDLVMMDEKKGILNIDVLSFARLAYRVFEETGKGNMPVLDDEGKNLILRRIASEVEDELRVLKGNLKKFGYISEVKSVLSEFDQYDISDESLSQVMEQVGEESLLYYKLQDMKLLWRKFHEFLDEKYLTKEEMLDALCKVIDESEILKRSVIAMDGFTGFTPVQNRLLEKLMKICKDVIVTVTIDERENPYGNPQPQQLFGMSKQMVYKLTELAAKNHIEQLEPIWKKTRPFPRFEKGSALEFLEQNLFRYGKQVYVGAQKQISIHEAANPREEAVAVAGCVRRLVRTKGYRYREIGVVVTDLAGYGDYLELAFSKYGIPVFIDHKRSILLNSFVEYVRSVLAMVENQFRFDAVFRFLRSGYAPFPEEEINGLENYCLALGIQGLKKWQLQWIRREQGMTEEDLNHLNHLRVLFIEAIEDLVFVLKQRKKTVRDITEALYRFLEKEQLQKKLKDQEEAFEQNGQLALAKEYAQIYAIMIGIFDKFVELLGEEKISLKEYCELLDAGLNEAKVGVIPPGLDQVIIGDIERTRQKDVKALFVMGVNDLYLPGNLLRTGLLNERDREKITDAGFVLTPGGKEKAYIQKFYLYQNLTKPEKELALFYSKNSTDGKALRPAYVISEVKRLFLDIVVEDEAKKTILEKELTPEEAFREVIEGLCMEAETSGGAWMELYTWYQKHPEWAEKIKTILNARFFQYEPGQISTEAARQLYGEHFQGSISRMETFAGCAFAHFLTYGLRLKERKEYEFQPLDLGNVFHATLEKYAKVLQNEGKTWTQVGEEERQILVKKCLEEAVTDYGNSVLYDSARNEYTITRINRLLNRTVWALTDQLERGDFVPDSYELNFGNGKIDRIDICQDEEDVYVKVIDYKTGMTGFDISALYYGLQLQLMVYMNAAVKMAEERFPKKTVVPAGVFYYRVDDPLSVKGTEGERLKSMRKQLRMDGVVNLEKDCMKHLDHTMESESMVVPVKWNKDGSLSKTSKAVEGREFQTMLQYAEYKKEIFREKIVSGEVQIQPAKNAGKTGCDYCMYRRICGFDVQMPGYDFQRQKKLSQEEALEFMRQELKESEGEIQ